VLVRLFREGPEGFISGLSAKKYIGITGAPRVTAIRDLQELVGKGALLRRGERKHTRYLLNLEAN
jgi:Fic family protein